MVAYVDKKAYYKFAYEIWKTIRNLDKSFCVKQASEEKSSI